MQRKSLNAVTLWMSQQELEKNTLPRKFYDVIWFSSGPCGMTNHTILG